MRISCVQDMQQGHCLVRSGSRSLTDLDPDLKIYFLNNQFVLLRFVYIEGLYENKLRPRHAIDSLHAPFIRTS